MVTDHEAYNWVLFYGPCTASVLSLSLVVFSHVLRYTTLV
jgi:hypothetical protein